MQNHDLSHLLALLALLLLFRLVLRFPLCSKPDDAQLGEHLNFILFNVLTFFSEFRHLQTKLIQFRFFFRSSQTFNLNSFNLWFFRIFYEFNPK